MAPRIPQYGESQVQERPLGIPNMPTDTPLSAFGGGQAAEDVTNQAVGLAGDIHKEVQRKYQEQYQHGINLQALEISNQLTAEATRAKNAMMQVQGKAAIGTRDSTLAGYDKFYQDIEKNISNDDVKRAAYAHFLEKKQQLDGFATPYEQGQVKEYDNNEILAELKINQEAAATDPRPENIAPLSMGSKLAWEDYGKRNGWSPKQIQEKQQEVGSAIHLTALKSISSAKQYAAAKEFFIANEQEFVGHDLVNAKAIVGRDTTLGDAYTLSDQVMAKNPATIAEAMTQLDALTKAADPEVRHHAEQLLTRRYELAKAGQKEETDKTFQEASKLINQPENYGKLPWEVVDSATWLSLPDNDRKALIASSYALMKPMKENDDYRGVTEWYAMANDDISKMSPADMEKWRGKLTRANYEKFAEQWGKVRKGEDEISLKTNHEDRDYFFTNAKNDGRFGLANMDTLANLGKHPDKSKEFETDFRAIQKLMETEQKAEGKKYLPQLKRQEVIDKYILDKPKKIGFFGRLFSTSPEQYERLKTRGEHTTLFNRFGGEVPKSEDIGDMEKERINKTIKRVTGKDASDEKILQLKQAEQMGATPEELRKLISQ